MLSGFSINRDSGFTTPETHGKWSLRASATGELVFDNVEVPKENLLPNVKGLKGPLGCLNSARYGISWGAIIGVRSALVHAPARRRCAGSLLLELERGGVDAVTQARWRWSITEYMPEVTLASRTVHLRPAHAITLVETGADGALNR